MVRAVWRKQRGEMARHRRHDQDARLSRSRRLCGNAAAVRRAFPARLFDDRDVAAVDRHKIDFIGRPLMGQAGAGEKLGLPAESRAATYCRRGQNWCCRKARGSSRRRRGRATRNPPAPDRRRTTSRSSPRKDRSQGQSPGRVLLSAFYAAARKKFLSRLRGAAFVGLGLELDEILDPHLLDQPHLGLEPVDMLFLALQDVHEQLAADDNP